MTLYKPLAQAIDAAGLTNNLQLSGKSYIIFALTDEAFAAVPQETLTALLKPENPAILNQIFAYHVTPGKYICTELKSGNVKTLKWKCFSTSFLPRYKCK